MSSEKSQSEQPNTSISAPTNKREESLKATDEVDYCAQQKQTNEDDSQQEKAQESETTTTNDGILKRLFKTSKPSDPSKK